MTALLLSFWSCVMLFAALVNRKFRWTRPHVGALLAFVGIGVLAPFCAAYFSAWLMRETPLHADSPDTLTRILTFFVAAGMGEELFKLGACLLAVMLLILLRVRLRPGTVVLGCVSVALTFAAIENAWCYIDRVDELGMLKRSYLAVPLHASMGFIHGLCIDRSLRTASALPLLFAYAVTVAIHTLYDVMDAVLVFILEAAGMGESIPHLDLPAELLYGPIVFPMLVWMILRWRKVHELECTEWRTGGNGP